MALDGIYRVTDLMDELHKIKLHGLETGASTGWKNLDEFYRVKKGMMSIVTGIPQCGKSEFIDALLVNLAQLQNWSFAIFSPENYPISLHVIKLMEKFIGKKFKDDRYAYLSMNEEQMVSGIDFIGEHFTWIYPDYTEKINLDLILGKTEIILKQSGIEGLVIDPWNELEHDRNGKSETDYISECLTKLRRFTRKHNIKTWLVAHPQKMIKNKDGKYDVPNPYDISGCYSNDTEVLTEEGWKRHDMVSISDHVACFDLGSGSWAYDRPSQIWEYDYSGLMHHYRGYTFDCLVTPNHRMVVKPTWLDKKERIGSGKGRPIKYEDKNWQFIESGDCVSELKIPLASEQIQPLIGLKTIKEFDADNALKIIGWWISEGHVSMGSLSFCQSVGPLALEMERTLDEMGAKYKASTGTSSKPGEKVMKVYRLYKRQHPDFCNWVIENCGKGCANKKLPNMIWLLNNRQKSILLEALLDGDGNRPDKRPGTSRYATTSKQLADDVQRLAISLGHPSTISMQPKALEHHYDRYQVNIGRRGRKEMCFRKARHFEEVPYQGKVYCLTVPTGAYITRRNGRMMIAGNSAHWRNKADFCLCAHRENLTIDEVDIYVQKVKFKHLGKIGKAHFTYEWYSGRFEEAGYGNL